MGDTKQVDHILMVISTSYQIRSASGNLGKQEITKTNKMNITTFNVRSLNKDENLIELEEELKNLKWDRLAEVKRRGKYNIAIWQRFLLRRKRRRKFGWGKFPDL